jgi:tetratricopeptide (TPR) repeat protein
MGNLALDKGDYVTARKCFQEVMNRNPQNLGLQENMRTSIARCDLALRDYDAAFDEYQRVLDLEKYRKAGPDQDRLYDANANIGLIHYKRKEFDKARQILEGLRENSPDRLPARLTLANVYKKMGQYELAETEYLFVISREPKNLVALNNLANIYRDTGRKGQARRYYEKCLVLEPRNPIVQKNMQRLEGKEPAPVAEE